VKEKIIKTILENTDEDLRVTDLVGLAEAIEKLYGRHYYCRIDWGGIDSDKWGELDGD